MSQVALGCVAAAMLSAAAPATPSIALQVASETAPSGGWAQIKVSLAAPALVASGRIVMDLDPTVFGNIGTVAVFSANGDAYGYANVQGTHLDATFTAPSGGLGQLRNLPVLVATVPVLAGLAAGKTTSVTVDPSKSTWLDPSGNQYSVSVTPGIFTVGGSLSIQSVTPGGGLLPAGTLVQITGTGFAAATSVTIDGVSVSSVVVDSPQQMHLTLGAAAELTGKRIVLQNADGSQVEYFSSLTSNSVETAFPGTASGPQPYFSGVQPLFPESVQSTGVPAGPSFSTAYALQNPNLTAVDVQLGASYRGVTALPMTTVSIPPGATYVYDFGSTGEISADLVAVSAASPIRMVEIETSYPSTTATPLLAGPVPAFLPPAISALGGPILLQWTIGTAVPEPLQIDVRAVAAPANFTASASTQSGGPWLSVTPTQGTTTNLSFVTVTANPTGLAPGNYNGTVTVTADGGQSSTVSVLLSVLPPPSSGTLSASQSSFVFQEQPFSQAAIWQTISITSQTPAPFTVAASPGAFFAVCVSCSNFPQTSNTTGTTPAMVTVWMFFNEPAGTYKGSVIITGPDNTLTLPVELDVAAPAPLTLSPSSLELSAAFGSTASLSRGVQLAGSSSPVGGGPAAPTTTVSSDGNWLTAAVESEETPFGVLTYYLQVTANPSGLAPGLHSGTVTVSRGGSSAQLPVTLLIWTTPPPLALTPSTVTLSGAAGATLTQTVSVDSPGTPLTLEPIANPGPGLTLSAYSQTGLPTVAPFSLTVSASAQLPGIYSGTVNLSGSDGSVIGVVPVTLIIGASPYQPPQITAVVNGASQTPGSLSPGEIITIHGSGIGPPGIFGFAYDASGKVATNLGGLQVLFDGKPAPVIYASPIQINAVVPFEVASQTTTSVQVTYGGLTSAAVGIPVAPSAPGVFTESTTGLGAAAVENQDYSLNTPQNPAQRGAMIIIYGTGGGQTTPAGITGGSTTTSPEPANLPVSVNIGGIDVTPIYAGAAGNSIEGLFQVNVVVPPDVAPGPAVPVVVNVGGVLSQTAVTIAVQ